MTSAERDELGFTSTWCLDGLGCAACFVMARRAVALVVRFAKVLSAPELTSEHHATALKGLRDSVKALTSATASVQAHVLRERGPVVVN